MYCEKEDCKLFPNQKMNLVTQIPISDGHHEEVEGKWVPPLYIRLWQCLRCKLVKAKTFK